MEEINGERDSQTEGKKVPHIYVYCEGYDAMEAWGGLW